MKKQIKQDICTAIVTINICLIIFCIGILVNCFKRENMVVDTYICLPQQQVEESKYDEVSIDGIMIIHHEMEE